MARRSRDVEDLLRRIEALDDADRANLLARLMMQEGRTVDGNLITRVRRRFKGQSTSSTKVAVDEAVREVRRGRRQAR